MTGLTTVVETPAYLSKATRLMSDEERSGIVDVLAANPQAGVVIPGTGGLRKMRIGLQGRGKRGGGRVIYWFHSGAYPVVLLWAFAKNEASDLTPDQHRRIAEVTARLLEDFGGKR
jgi:hypothetical protein